MQHLRNEQFYRHVFDRETFSVTDSNHLGDCARCQSALAAVRHLAQELAIARRSQPSPEQRTQYYQFFQQVQSRRPDGWTSRLIQQVRMTLALDSRQRPAMQGVRSGAVQSYRLLYSADPADVELLVEPQAQGRRVEGDLLPLDVVRLAMPALIELWMTDSTPFAMPAAVTSNASTSPAHTSGSMAQQAVESDSLGRFHLEDVAPGRYDLYITPAAGPLLQIQGVAIT